MNTKLLQSSFLQIRSSAKRQLDHVCTMHFKDGFTLESSQKVMRSSAFLTSTKQSDGKMSTSYKPIHLANLRCLSA